MSSKICITMKKSSSGMPVIYIDNDVRILFSSGNWNNSGPWPWIILKGKIRKTYKNKERDITTTEEISELTDYTLRIPNDFKKIFHKKAINLLKSEFKKAVNKDNIFDDKSINYLINKLDNHEIKIRSYKKNK